MSLVNDALKRAKQSAPKNAAPAAGPALHMAESARRAVGTGFLLAMLIVVILLLAGLMLWQWSHTDDAGLQVRANSLPAANTSAPSAPVAQDSPVPAQPAAATLEPATTGAVAIEPPHPAPITYKLQSIVYLPENPSAVINGKFVFVDGSVDGARVAAIGPGTATIVTATGQTNVLVMR